MAERLQLLLRQLRRSRAVPGVVLVLALGVLAGTVAMGALYLRHYLHRHLINRDGELLSAVARAQQFAAEDRQPLARRMQDPVGQLELALTISQLKDGVMAVRLFDAQGQFVLAFPPEVREATLSQADWARLERLAPASHFHPAVSMTAVFLLPPGAPAPPATPMLEVNIPLHAPGEQRLLATAQLILDARELAQELAALDRQVWLQAVLVFLGAALLMAAALLWAYRRLQRTQRLLQDRTAHLLRANHELTLAAKTRALGAVTAHLIHGLTNPLASLQQFMANRPAEAPGEADWQGALDSTRRMQEMVEEVVRVLGEENGADQYELTVAELLEVLQARHQDLAHERGVALSAQAGVEAVLSNREANLVLLILENLVHNALQATPCGRTVRVSATHNHHGLEFAVADQGAGFPEHLRERLFAPCRSTRGGSGLGLAISHQLAGQLSARLTLARSSAAGCVFELLLPRRNGATASSPAESAPGNSPPVKATLNHPQ